MKKGIIPKLLLLLIIVAMIGTLAACGNKTTTKKPSANSSVVDALGKIANQLDPILKEVQKINENQVPVVDLSIGANVYSYASKATNAAEILDSKHSVSIAAALNKNDPQASILYKLGEKEKNTLDSLQERFLLAYQNNKAYLQQPINMVNTTATTPNKAEMDISGITPAIKDGVALMLTAIGANIENAKFLDEPFKNFSLESISDLLKEIEGLGLNQTALAELIGVTANKDKSEHTLTIKKGLVDFLYTINVLPLEGDIGAAVDSVINSLFDVSEGLDFFLANEDHFPTIAITSKATAEKGTMKSLTITIKIQGYFGFELEIGNLNTLKVGTTGSANMHARSGYTRQVLNLGLHAALPEKTSNEADVQIYVDGNLTKGSKIGATLITYKDPTSNSAAYVPAYFDGTQLVMQLKQAFRHPDFTVGDAAASYAYKGTVMDYPVKEGTDATYGELDEEAEKVATDIYTMINRAARKALNEYEWVDSSLPNPPANNTLTPPSKTMEQIIWEFITGTELVLKGGTATSAGTYDKKTQADVLQALDAKVREYVTPTDNLVIFVKNTTTGTNAAANDDTFSKFLKRMEKVWDEQKAAIIGTEDSHKEGDYGIFYQAKKSDNTLDKYRYGLRLTKGASASATDPIGLLEAINIFIKQENAGKNSADGKWYLYTVGSDGKPTTTLSTTPADITPAFLDTLESRTDLINGWITAILGVPSLQTIFNDETDLEVFTVENGGLVGTLTLKSATKEYATLTGKFQIIAYNAATITNIVEKFEGVSVADLETGFTELNDGLPSVYTLTADIKGADDKVIAKSGTEFLVKGGKVLVNGKEIAGLTIASIGENFEPEDGVLGNLRGLFDLLSDMRDAFKELNA